MLRKWYVFFIIAVISMASLLSCSDYQKAMKSDDLEFKYNMAISYYEQEDYFKAYPLLEELIPLYRGTKRAREVYYYYCYSNYYLGDYLIAAYHFKKYAKTYPNSKHSKEALFMSAFCYYLTSPQPTLDQSTTYKAISELQLFINTYPGSKRVDSCNVLIDDLRGKLEAKAYKKSKLYYDMESYQAAIVSFENLMEDFPETEKKEEIRYKILESYYYLAVNSIKDKKLERIENTIKEYYKFVDRYENSKYLDDAAKIFDNIVKEKEKFLNQNS